MPIDTENETAYLTGILNSPTVSGAISVYAAQLSLGTSVVEYSNIPAFDASDPRYERLAQLTQEITCQGGTPEKAQVREIAELVAQILGLE